MRGNPHAPSGRIVIPSVVRANQAVVLHTPARKLGATMEAKILPRAHASAAAPKDEVVSEQSGWPDFARSEVRRHGHHVPIVQQNWIIDHNKDCSGYSRVRRSPILHPPVSRPVERGRISQPNLP